jgi:ParB family chromosome partitioning protein
VAEGKEEFETVPCRYKDMTEIEFRIALLIGNTFNRKMSDYDLMTQAADWKEVLTQARKEGLLVLEAGERVRDYVAAVMGESVPKIRTLNTIDQNATPEVKEQFQKGNMGITAAMEASRADEGTQKEIAKASEDKGGMGAEEIKAMAEEKKHRKTKEEETREANVSDTDTTKEEKENARKLHAVKMIEKYYTWLNEEETGILERMLEDLKRRKREYAIEEE